MTRKALAARLNGIFGALADPTRRAIIEQLTRGEARVTDIAQPFALSLNAASKHIRVLEAVGLVRRRVDGRDHYLAFDSGPLDDADGWLTQTRAFWNAPLGGMERLLREKGSAKERGGHAR